LPRELYDGGATLGGDRNQSGDYEGILVHKILGGGREFSAVWIIYQYGEMPRDDFDL
jgi:hypothetical protein